MPIGSSPADDVNHEHDDHTRRPLDPSQHGSVPGRHDVRAVMTPREERWAREVSLMEDRLDDPDLDDEERAQIERALEAYDERFV